MNLSHNNNTFYIISKTNESYYYTMSIFCDCLKWKFSSIIRFIYDVKMLIKLWCLVRKNVEVPKVNITTSLSEKLEPRCNIPFWRRLDFRPNLYLAYIRRRKVE